MSDFQHRSGEHGRMFEDQCRSLLHHAGYQKVSDRPEVCAEIGCEIDVVALTKTGETHWFDCKGGWMGGRPGFRRTDNVKKALSLPLLAHIHGEHPDIIMLTSHLPAVGSRGEQMLQVAISAGAVRAVICINDIEDVKRLQEFATAHIPHSVQPRSVKP